MRKKALAILAMVAWVVASAHAQNSAAKDDLNRRTIERRAIEATIWGMPVINFDLMLQELLTKTDGKVNQVVYGDVRSIGIIRRSPRIPIRSISWLSLTRRMDPSCSTFRRRL